MIKPSSHPSTGSHSPKANVLINHNRRACISDFSLITMISDPQTFLSSCIEGGTTPWMSPELLDPESFGLKASNPTKESDCYALGMVVYEVLSGRAPFTPSRAPVLKVLRGERPERPRENERKLFTDDIWGMVQRCWEPQPGDRANARAILLSLKGDRSALGQTLDMGGTVGADIDSQSDATSSDSSRCSTFCLRFEVHHQPFVI